MKRKIRSWMSVVIVICMTLALPLAGLAAVKTFPDMNGHWAENYVSALAEKGGISGFPDGKFYPSREVTLPEFVKIIVGANYGEIPPTGSHWASGYMDKAVDLGLIDPGSRMSYEILDRFTAVSVIHNSLLNIYYEQDDEDASATDFIDYPTSCHDCINTFDTEIAQCYTKGIITGKPGPLFDGYSSLTRAEASAMIMRMIDKNLRILPENPDVELEPPTYYPIKPESAELLLESVPGIVLLDVRSEADHNAKYIPSKENNPSSISICIPLANLEAGDMDLLPADKETPIIVYCQVGARSKTASDYLVKAGYITVYHLGGIDDWPYQTASK